MLNITKEKLRRQRKLLLALKKYLFKRLNEIESVTFIVDKNLSEERFIKRYKLNDFFKEYFDPLLARTKEDEDTFKPRQGAHIVKRSILAAAWGSLIYQNGQRMNWALLADLYEWFWAKFNNFPYYRSIKPPDDLVNYLTVQYHRHKEDSDCIYCVETYGQTESLTIFASHAAFVDRGFVYVDDILENMHGKKEIPRNLPWEHELAFEGNDLAEYLRFSLSLFKKYGTPTIHKSPLIIFPDKSRFSTEF
jgi:hypothetical protein